MILYYSTINYKLKYEKPVKVEIEIELEKEYRFRGSKKMNKIKSQKKKLWKVFLLAMGVTFIVCIMGTGIGAIVYNTFIHNDGVKAMSEKVEKQEDNLLAESENEMDEKKLLQLDKRVNKTVAIFGTDVEGLRTDVVLVANFNSETNKVNVISVPRDTKVDWKSDQRSFLPTHNAWVKTSKINEMTAWGGIEQVRELTVRELENILGIKIDNYAVISTSVFREIIDAIGGVEFEVTERMKKDDYSQNLHIDLYPGIQLLDGDKAEQLVRYRDYIDGDLGRIKVQQKFLQAFAQKVLSPEIMIKLPKIIPVLLTSIKTDISLLELPEYYPYIKTFDINNLSFYTLPGIDRYENGISYYIANIEEIEELVNKLFFSELYE